MPRGTPVPVGGIWLRREGNYVVVLAEDPDTKEYVELICERHDSAFSHNISEWGIRSCFEKKRKT